MTTKPEVELEPDWFEMMNDASKQISKSVWYNPNKTLEECERDFLECKHNADTSVYTPFSSVFKLTLRKIDYIATGMQTKGYTLTPIKELPTDVRQAETLYGGWNIAGK